MIINFNKIFSIYLILILFSCSKSELSDNLTKDVHDQLSTNVEITLTKKGNITAKIKSEILKKNNQSLQLELYNNVNVNLFDESFQQKYYLLELQIKSDLKITHWINLVLPGRAKKITVCETYYKSFGF